ncbi:MAG: hypothetical protein IT319_19955 [Anaerolineae bacterium]|nr:hypothetical protein [Anaerolineae bacterium]
MMSDAVYALYADDHRLYAARASGLFASVDGGQHWKPLYNSLHLDHPLPTTAVAASGTTILAGVSGGVLHSVDGGGHWQFRRYPTPAPIISALLLADFALAGTLEDGVFHSPDAGATWQPRNYGLLDPCILALAVTRSGVVFAGTSSGLFRSDNGGCSWHPTAFPRVSVLSLAAAADGEILVGTEDAGLWRSAGETDQWQPLTDTAADVPVNQLLSDHGYAAAGCGHLLLISLDDGRTWSPRQVFAEPVAALARTANETSVWVAHGDQILTVQP